CLTYTGDPTVSEISTSAFHPSDRKFVAIRFQTKLLVEEFMELANGHLQIDYHGGFLFLGILHINRVGPYSLSARDLKLKTCSYFLTSDLGFDCEPLTTLDSNKLAHFAISACDPVDPE